MWNVVFIHSLNIYWALSKAPGIQWFLPKMNSQAKEGHSQARWKEIESKEQEITKREEITLKWKILCVLLIY